MSEFDTTSQYWVHRDGTTTGPYSLEQVRGFVLPPLYGAGHRELGRIWITDQVKNIAMPEWVSVDKLLRDTGGDNKSDYWVRRGGQLSGPYNIEILYEWVTNGSGRIMITDEAKNIAMLEWVSVGQVIRDATRDQPGSPPPPPPPHK